MPVLDACLKAFKEHALDDPVVSAIVELMSPEVIDEGSVRAVDAALVVGQLAVALGPEKPGTAPVFSLDDPSTPNLFRQGF